MKLDSLDVAVRVENMGKRYLIGSRMERPTLLQTARRWLSGVSAQRALWALRDVNFELRKGEILGIIGPNGSGKSTILLLIAQIIAPTEGSLRVFGKTNPFFQLSAGLQPELTVLENFSLCAALLGIPRAEFNRKLPEMVSFSGLEPYLYAKFMELSTGLAARLPFAAAVHADLDILLVDEMLSVGDIAFQMKCKETFQEFQRQGKTLLIISHSMDMIRSLCPRVLYLREGAPIFLGEATEAISRFMRDMRSPEPGRASSPPAPPPKEQSNGRPDVSEAEFRSLLEATRLGNERLLKQEEVLRGISLDVKSLADRPAPIIDGKASGRGLEPAASEDYGVRLEKTIQDWKSLMDHEGPLILSDSPVFAVWIAVASLMAPELEDGLRAGDEVLVPALTYPGLVGALRAFGLVPIFTGLDPRTFNADFERLRAAFSRKTRAVVAVHSFGSCAPIDRVASFCREKSLWLLELSRGVEARFGRKALGTFGDLGYCEERSSRPFGANFGMVMARSARFDSIFRRIMFGPKENFSLLPNVNDFDFPLVQALGRRPGPSSAIVDRGQEISKNWTSPEKRASAKEARDSYSRFFSSFPALFALPTPPSPADIPSSWFNFMLKADAALSVEEVLQCANDRKIAIGPAAAAFECHPESRSDAMPFSRLLWERSLGIAMQPDEEARQRDFAELAKFFDGSRLDRAASLSERGAPAREPSEL